MTAEQDRIPAGCASSGNGREVRFERLFAAALLASCTDLPDPERLERLAALPLSRPADPAEWVFQGKRPSARRIESARLLARTWMDSGLRLIEVPARASDPPGRLRSAFVRGDTALLDRRLLAVLNSRKPRLPAPRDRWVRATAAAIRQADRNAGGLVTSLGNDPYEMAAYLALDLGIPQVVVCDAPLPWMGSPTAPARFLAEHAELADNVRVLFLSPFSPGTQPPRAQRQARRDAWVVGLAESLVMIEVRAGGHMERLASAALGRGVPVRVLIPNRADRSTEGNETLIRAGAMTFRLAPSTPPLGGRAAEPPTPARPSAQRRLGAPAEPCLYHFTRSCPGPWPGQARSEYYRSLAESRDGAAHEARDTLLRILDEKTIRGGSRMTRGPVRAVCFTAREWGALRELVRWRKALIRWTLEPFGLALPRRALLELGARPVVYGDESVWRTLPEAERFRFQLHRPPRTNWRMEKEWRLPGDLDLEAIPSDEIAVLVPTAALADEIAARYNMKTMVLEGFA
ncbi:MAG: DNA-protecting protein DprA [Proteobacteria bacterium]|nr:DNA-protecting protein DprA [Pseudomonadota bacterium]